MDYEKMYKEALERAKKFEEKYGGGYAEYIFPELAESEDERIRKELKEAFEAYDIESKWNGIPIRSIFAWLEKQKDINCLACDQHLKGYIAGRKATEEEKQKEQKPAWSEEDERKRLACIETINEVIDYERERWEDCNPGKPYRPIMKYDEQVDWLKSLRPQYHGDVTMTEAYKMGLEAGKASSWKPSEEQMAALEAATVRYQSTALESLYEDLKKL